MIAMEHRVDQVVIVVEMQEQLLEKLFIKKVMKVTKLN